MTYIDDIWDAVPEGAEPELFPLRRGFLLGNVRPAERVLDVGCGEGAFSAALHEAGARPIAVDVADEPLRRLRARFPHLDDVRRARIGEPLPVPDDEVDAAWAGEVVEHVVDVGGFCSELRRVVKPGGKVLLTTPDHPRALLARLAASPRAFDDHFDPYTDHVRFFTKRTLARVLDDAGFTSAVAIEAKKGHLLACAS